MVAIHHKGIVAEGEVGAVRISQELENEVGKEGWGFMDRRSC